jgi:hypothetical protein
MNIIHAYILGLILGAVCVFSVYTIMDTKRKQSPKWRGRKPAERFKKGHWYISTFYPNSFPQPRKCVDINEEGFALFVDGGYCDSDFYWACDGTFEEVTK